MWRTDTFWFDVAIIMSMLAFGNILFGHFEEHRPKWRRVLKTILMLALFLTISATAGRVWALAALVLPLIFVLWIHLVYLPKHGVNGWTGEPKEKYYELIKAKK